MLTPNIKKYFQQMQPGNLIHISQAKDPMALTRAAIQYDREQPGDIQINGNYERILKLTTSNNQ